MKQFCQYHPAKPAYWSCKKCGKTMCQECVEARDMGGHRQGQKLHVCPNCNLPVDWLGVGNVMDPFWKRIPRFFLYPFYLRPLALMLTLSVVAVLVPKAGILSLMAAVVIWGIVFKYAYAILQTTMSGNLTAPSLNATNLYQNFGPVAKQMGIYSVVYFLIGFVIAELGRGVGIPFMMLILLFLPAMIMLLVCTESLLAAINPLMFVTLTVRIGWGYLLMYFFYSLLGGAPALLGRQVLPHLAPLLQVFLFTLLKIYYTFISYHLMGYVILQYHEAIGYQVDFEDYKTQDAVKADRTDAVDSPESLLLKRINQQIKDGDHESALRTIERETGSKGIADPLLSERYFTLLKMTGAEGLLTHGRNHLDLLVRSNKKAEALSAYTDCLSSNPTFAPSAGILFKLGGWLDDAGKSKEALAAFSKLTKTYPQDPLVPKSYFRAAQIIHDRLLNPEKARTILAGLIKKYPQHDIIPFVERYLAQMG
jgi:tetratricopeptide (TPR) repeat protein